MLTDFSTVNITFILTVGFFLMLGEQTGGLTEVWGEMVNIWGAHEQKKLR